MASLYMTKQENVHELGNESELIQLLWLMNRSASLTSISMSGAMFSLTLTSPDESNEIREWMYPTIRQSTRATGQHRQKHGSTSAALDPFLVSWLGSVEDSFVSLPMLQPSPIVESNLRFLSL